MKAKTLLIALVALLIAGGTGLLIQNWMRAQQEKYRVSNNRPVEKIDEGLKILVAAKKLPAGTLLTPAHMEWRSWPSDGLDKKYVVKNKGKKDIFVGAVVRNGIAVGEPIVDGRVVKPGDRGFMAAVLIPGMRAVSVQVNRTSGISGFVFPGDRVDLILTHQYEIELKGNKRKLNRVSETVLTGVRVLAVDQNTNDQEGTPKLAKTATLEVTPRQAEMVAVAANLGKLSLSLRSLTVDEAKGIAEAPDGPARKGGTYTRDADVSALINRSGAKQVEVLRGNDAKNIGK